MRIILDINYFKDYFKFYETKSFLQGLLFKNCIFFLKHR